MKQLILIAFVLACWTPSAGQPESLASLIINDVVATNYLTGEILLSRNVIYENDTIERFQHYQNILRQPQDYIQIVESDTLGQFVKTVVKFHLRFADRELDDILYRYLIYIGIDGDILRIDGFLCNEFTALKSGDVALLKANPIFYPFSSKDRRMFQQCGSSILKRAGRFRIKPFLGLVANTLGCSIP